MNAENITAVLEDLIETLEDGRRGFEQVADHIDGTGHEAMVIDLRELSRQREEFSVELRTIAAQHGVEIQDEGTMTGAMHRGWMSLKDALTGDDPKAVLGAAETGEDHAVSEFDDALDADLPEDVRSVIQRQAQAVRGARNAVKALRDSY